MASKEQLEQELTGLENQYKAIVKHNPCSINDTKDHLRNIDQIVRRMKTIRNSKTINRPVDGNGFLKELLYPVS